MGSKGPVAVEKYAKVNSAFHASKSTQAGAGKLRESQTMKWKKISMLVTIFKKKTFAIKTT